jgi:hypothetical protein
MPRALKERAVPFARAQKLSMTAFICQALAEKLNALETEKKEKEREAQQQRQGSNQRAQQKDFLAPEKEDLVPVREVVSTIGNNTDPTDEMIYQEHARKIIAVLEMPAERDRRVKAAIASIKSKRPLTHPGDQEIMKRLENAVIILRANGEEPSLLQPAIEDSDKPSTLSRLVDKIVSRFDPPEPENKG